MPKPKTNLNKIFLILTPFLSLVFLQSASYEMPIYNLEVKKDKIWGDLSPKTQYSFTETNDNFNFVLDQEEKDWKISIGIHSPYGGYTGQSDIVKNFSKDWFSTYHWVVADFHGGGFSSHKSTIPDGVYNLNNKPSDAIPDDNFEIDLQDILHEKTKLWKGQKFTDFFNYFNISLFKYKEGYKKDFHSQDIRDLGQKFTNLFNNDKRDKFNLTNIKLNFEYTVQNNKITKLAVTIRAFVEYKSLKEEENKEDLKLKNYFLNLRNSFFSTFPNRYEIPTDTGANGGLNAPRPIKTNSDTNANNLKSNKEYFEEKLKSWWNKNATINNSNANYNSQYKYNIWTNSKNPADLWIEFDHPTAKNKQKFYIVNVDSSDKFPTHWKPTQFLLQKEFSSRLELIPSEVLKYDSKLARLIKIKAEKKAAKTNQTNNPQNTNNDQNIYAGEFEFVGDIQVKFHAAKDESEVLFINGKKIDVLDNQFESVLQDLRLEQNENGGRNKYKIEIKKYDKTKNKVEKTYSIDLITKSVVNVLQGKWFGWDPNKNLNQKKLINEYLLDDSGNEIIGQDGKKLKNPEYDPNIDPQTGTKKQILWVRNNGADLKDNVFYQDPNILEKGFIAEGAVVGKGINLTFSQNFQDDKAIIKKYKIDQSQKNTFSLAPKTTQFSSTSSSPEGEEIKINNNEIDYFSASGLWLFRVGYEFEQQAFKLFLIGDNDNTKLFSDIVDSNIYIPFWQSPAGYKLKNYLSQIRGFNNKYIENLSYEKIILHWKSYINYKYDKGEIADPISSLITNKIEKELENYLRKQNNFNFSNNQKIQLKNLDFKDIELYLTEEQKSKLKEIEIIPFKNGQDWVYQVDSDFSQSLGLNNALFEFPGLKTDKELKNLKLTKTEIKIGDIEQKIKDLINKNPFADPKTLINKTSILLNSELKDKNVALEIETTKEGDFTIKLKSDNDHFLVKDQYKFNLKKLQEKAQDNYDVFSVLPKNIKINLKGITNPDKALEYIKEQIKFLSNNQLNFGQNYSFDPKLLSNPSLFEIYQGDLDSAKSQGKLGLSGIDLPGYFKLDIVNVVPNISHLKEKNLSKIKLKDIKINSKDPEEIVQQLKEELNKQLAPWGLNWEEYLTPEDFDKILRQIQHNKFSEISFKPSNFLTEGSLKFNVENFGFEPYKFNLPGSEENKSFIQNKKNLYWFIPLTIIVLSSLSFGIWFLIRKKFKKFN
ncbi:Mbov_0399 family ICE element protein [Mesomycoplasma hyopneumoniae]|uniref:Mbov_0399 family ICE element protein n=1 Tax=Mesomycoplasma hyopneumoniae TaxID=2099 RepID=UPI00136C2C15|nr:hypothetical protein [Mesomycoplasma hyopneumoniae]MXR33709.1 hypothetical protein [Mesomycoplasma hyopneumoniae]